MVDMIQSPFMWGTDGKPRSPAQVKQQRDVAAALLASAPQGKGWASALGEAVKGLSAGINNNQAGIYEQQGLERAGDLFSGIGPESESSVIAAALADPAAIWATPAQSGVAEALLGEQMRQNSPDFALDLAYKQAQLEALQNPQAPAASYFGSTLPYANADGSLGYVQLSNAGLPELPPGARWLEPTSTVNTGTAQTVIGRNTGAVQGAIPIDNLTPAQDTAVGTGLGNQQLTTIEAGRNAASNNAKLGVIETLLSTAPQGGQGKLVQLAGGLGIDIGGLSEVQAAQAVINQMVPLQRAPGSGTMSDADLELYKASLPAIINQPQANQLVIATQRSLNNYAIQHADIEQRLVNKQITQEQAMQEKAAIPNPLEEFKKYIQTGTQPSAAPPQSQVTIRKISD